MSSATTSDPTTASHTDSQRGIPLHKPRALILRAAGSNCDVETAYAFELAGASADRVHLNRILENPSLLDECQLLAIPGGFSYGDDIAAGRIFANQIHHHLADALRKFVDAGKPIIGICNGFQVLIKTDLLPGPLGAAGGQSCTLAHNDSGRFIDRWIRLTPPAPASRCIWTAGLGPIELPIAHGEGKFIARDQTTLRALHEAGRVALVYADSDNAPAPADSIDNPNGSADAIAGICDATGLIFGLMPHPERFIDPIQHPAWTSRPDLVLGHGLSIFQNAVRHVANS